MRAKIPTEIKMADTTNTEGTEQGGEAADEGSQDASKDAGAATGDWQGRYTGQLKVNRDLEKKLTQLRGTDLDLQLKVNRDLESKLNQLRDGLKGALGIDDKKADATELVSKLQEQLNSLAHTNTVSDVARRHRITDDEDLAILSGIRDKDAMEKLAARLSPADGNDPGKPGSSTTSGKPGTPKPDPSQGSAGGGKASTSVAAGRDLWSERHPTTK